MGVPKYPLCPFTLDKAPLALAPLTGLLVYNRMCRTHRASGVSGSSTTASLAQVNHISATLAASIIKAIKAATVYCCHAITSLLCTYQKRRLANIRAPLLGFVRYKF